MIIIQTMYRHSKTSWCWWNQPPILLLLLLLILQLLLPIKNDSNNVTLVTSIYDLSDYHHSTTLPATTSILNASTGSGTTTTTTTSSSRRYISDISTAICYKTLFGTSIDIGVILQWIAYHHLLGFDHFFFFYRDEVTVLSNWDLLASNPLVTMIEWNNIGTLEGYYDQAPGTEVQCLTNYAAHYDWVYIADIDEYLFLGTKDRTNDPTLFSSSSSSTNINQQENGYIVTPFSSMTEEDADILTVKELLHIYDNMTYLSFGKRQYSLDHRTWNDVGNDDDSAWTMTNYQIQTVSTSQDENGGTKTTLRPDTRFIVSKYPYYMSSYFCHHRGFRRGDTICPVWRGRSKVLVRPQYHHFIDVHGTYGLGDLRQPHIHNGTVMHFHPDLYHIKEWPHMYSKHNITIHYPPSSSDGPDSTKNNIPSHMNNYHYIDNYDNFTIVNETEVRIHNVHTGYLPFYINSANGINEEVFLMKRDVTLHDYFQKVMNLATSANGTPIRVVQTNKQKMR